MGRDARAKQQRWAKGESVSRGNPEPAALRTTYIDASKKAEASAAGQQLRAKFSDREYVVNEKGVLRRAAPRSFVVNVKQTSA